MENTLESIPPPAPVPDNLNLQLSPNQRDKFLELDELLIADNILPQDQLKLFIDEAKALRPLVHRVNIPLHKKGGSVSFYTLEERQSPFVTLYESRELRSFLETLVGKPLYTCPSTDAHACALYYYQEDGDYITWHYDSSFYESSRYTVLVGLEDTTSDDSCKFTYDLYTRTKMKPVEKHSDKMEIGQMVVFNGDRLYHMISPLKGTGERIVFSMEFVTDRRVSMLGRCICALKDSVMYFGLSALMPRKKKTRPLLTHKASQTKNPVDDVRVRAYINPTSGGANAAIAHQFLELLQSNSSVGKANAFDLTSVDLSHLPTDDGDRESRLLVAGGSGSVNSIIQSLVNGGVRPLPALGVIPMGKSVDLARQFGWGVSHTPDAPEINTLLWRLREASPTPMDVWRVRTTTAGDDDAVDGDDGGIAAQVDYSSEGVFFNHLVVAGIRTSSYPDDYSFEYSDDAVHQALQALSGQLTQAPAGWFSRARSLSVGVAQGLRNALMGVPMANQTLEVKVDGKRVELTDNIVAVAFLNLTSIQKAIDTNAPMSAPAVADELPEPSKKRHKQAVGSDEETSQVKQRGSSCCNTLNGMQIPRLNDGLLEVVGITNTLQVVRLSFKRGHKFAQGSHVEVQSTTVNAAISVACDGELDRVPADSALHIDVATQVPVVLSPIAEALL